MPRSHIHRYRVAFVDCDPAQIVHFSNYFRWFDTASREFFTACGVPAWRDTERDSGIIGTPLVDAQASFRNPATYGEDLEIESWVETWNTKSFVMRHVARRGDTVIAEGREVRVFAVREAGDPTRIRAVPIPERICWGCDKYCPADSLACGNGSGRTLHPAEMLGDDWYTYGDWGFAPDVTPQPRSDLLAETEDKA